jgi:hypothetical protein
MRNTLSSLALFVFSNIALAIPATYFHITDFSGNTATSLMTSYTINLPIWEDGYLVNAFDIKIEAVGSGILDNPVITASGRNPVYDSIIQSDATSWEISGRADSGFFLSSGITSPFSTLDFNFEGPGDVTLTLYRNNGLDWVPLYSNPGMATMTIHQIPEPITLVFLGMGGLMLRRRK